MKQDIQSFLQDLQLMSVCNSKYLSDVLTLAVEQPTLLETHRLFYRYAVSNDLYTSTVASMVKKALCSAQNTALMEKLTGTDGRAIHPERFMFCAVEYLTGRRPKIRFQLHYAISEADYDLLLHYKTQSAQVLSKRLNLQPGSLYSRYRRAQGTAMKALDEADAGASASYLLYWYNLCPERLAMLRELQRCQWRFHDDYASLQEPQKSIYRLTSALQLNTSSNGGRYLVDALTFSLKDPGLLQSGQVWHSVANHFQVNANKVTCSINQTLTRIRESNLLMKLIGMPQGHLHYAKFTAVLYWCITSKRINFLYNLPYVFTQMDTQYLTTLDQNPMPIAQLASQFNIDKHTFQYRMTRIGRVLSMFSYDMEREVSDRYLLYQYGLTEDQLPFYKSLAEERRNSRYQGFSRFLTHRKVR